MLAYLVIREGTKWTDVFRLMPRPDRDHRPGAHQPDRHQGRALQPLPCRGVSFAGPLDASRPGKPQRHRRRPRKPIRGDHVLTPGDIIRIGHSQMAFVQDLTKAFPDTSAILRDLNVRRRRRDQRRPIADEDANVLAASEPTTITHRRGQTKYLEPPPDDEDSTQFRRSAGRRPNCAAWHSSWPKRPTSNTIARWRSAEFSRAP